MSLAARYLPVASGITTVQATTYLLFVCLFSISFLVFLNSSVSFVITDLLGIKRGVGDLVGTLGFVDELVALAACPAWGIISDRLGVKWVCSLGYLIVGISLFVFVQARNVYPQLLLARMLFSIGGAATATMVTAVLPSLTEGSKQPEATNGRRRVRRHVPELLRHSITPSLDSQATITPENYSNHVAQQNEEDTYAVKNTSKHASPPRLAGVVGFATGCGALLALALFLPLPARFSSREGVTQGQAVADSFYVVGVIALIVSGCCYLGLRNLQGEQNKGWKTLLSLRNSSSRSHVDPLEGQTSTLLPYWRLLFDSSILGIQDARIGLGYLGGFVARASSVGISLFIPLYINAYFISHGFCQGSPNDPSPELKKQCRAAYVLSAQLTGSSQLVALLCAPLFGYLSARYPRYNIPLVTAAVCGIIGYTVFAQLPSPEVKDVDGRGGSTIVFLAVALIGISQIGAIVCSLGLLGRGVLDVEAGHEVSSSPAEEQSEAEHILTQEESALLLPARTSAKETTSRAHLKGSIAGVYSLFGGAAILLLTKLGGYLFDALSTGAPFYMMAIFNAVLLVVCIAHAVWRRARNVEI